MKKTAWWFIGIYLVYMAVMALYLFKWSSYGVPPKFQGTAADPQTFMTAKQMTLSEHFARIKDWLYFISVPFKWGIYLFVLIFGFSRWLRTRSEDVSRFSIVHTAIYVLAFSVLSWILTFPIDWFSHHISVSYDVSVQSFSSWLRDSLVSFWIDWLITLVTVIVIFFFIRKMPKRWWLPVWLLSIPFTLFLMYLQPVVIDPLYNDFYTLQSGHLKTEILDLAAKANIPAHNVYEVDMSKKTSTMNAYVNGIGNHLRIVLWDTTLNKLSDKQVLFVMAHEMGHYVMHHLVWGMIGSIIMTLVGLYFASYLLRWIVGRWGYHLGIKHPGDLAALPIILLIFSVLTFAASPLENVVERHYEHQADQYALHMTQDPQAGISGYQKLTVNSLSDVNPPRLVKWFLYNHPTMLERISNFENYQKSNGSGSSS